MSVVLSREVARRALALVLLCAGLAEIPAGGVVRSTLLMAAAIVIYLAVPQAERPDKALVYEKLPAVYGPDFVGFLLTGFFFALPFWARMGESYLWDDFGILVHPAALLTWPLALIALAIFWFSAHYAAFWLVIRDEGLQINRLEGPRLVPFSSISEIKPFRRGLPKWTRWLTPLMMLTGRYRAAGAVLLARDTVGITLALCDGTEIAIPEEGFEKNLRQVLSVLRKRNVKSALQSDG